MTLVMGCFDPAHLLGADNDQVTAETVQPALPNVIQSVDQGTRAFCQSPVNEHALKLLDIWRADLLTNHANGVLLTGASGAGKTWLARYVVAQTNFAMLDGSNLVAALTDPPANRVLVLDNTNRIDDPPLLLRFIDLCRVSHRLFLLVGSGRPRDWAEGEAGLLVDLETRLLSMPVAHLEKPDEELLASVLIQQLEERQIRIDRDVAAVAASRLKRSFHALGAFVDHLDIEALRRQKSIDRTLVQEVLKNLPEHALS